MRSPVRGFLVIVSLVLVCASSAYSKNFIVMPFEPENGATAPSWLGYVLSVSLQARIDMVPGFRTVNWQKATHMERVRPRTWPKQPFSESELASMSRRISNATVIVGRYKVENGKLAIHYRIWDDSKLKDGTASFPLDSAYASVGGLSSQICMRCGCSDKSDLLKSMKGPTTSSEVSFNLYGQVIEALSEHRAKDASQLIDKWVRIDPKCARVWGLKAGLVHNKPNEVITYCQKAISLDPTYTMAWSRMAWAYFRRKDYARARNCFEKLIDLNPNNPDAYVTLAFVDNKLSRKQESRNAMSKAVACSDDWLSCLAVGCGYYVQDEFETSIKCLEKALSLGAPQEAAALILGDGYCMLKRDEDAIKEWTIAIRSDGKSASRIESLLRRCIKNDPKDAWVRYDYGWLMYVEKNYAAAELSLKLCTSLDPKNSDAHALLAKLYRNQHRSLAAEKEELMASSRFSFPVTMLGALILLAPLVFFTVMFVKAITISLKPAEHSTDSEEDQSEDDLIFVPQEEQISGSEGRKTGDDE